MLVSPLTRELIAEPLEVAQEQKVFPKGVKEPLLLAHVTGIGGEYGLSCRRQEEAPVPLERPREVSFFIIRDKHCDLEPQIGRLTALSRTGAVMETGVELKQFDNLQLEAGSKPFCKVISQEGSGWLLRFTTSPANLDGVLT